MIKECEQVIDLKVTSLRPMSILMVEDNKLDALLASEILSESGNFLYQIEEVKDGVDAMAYLRRCCDAGNTLPDLILLDLNLPRMNGFEFLGELAKAKGFRTIPVIVLTTSSDEEDIERVQDVVDSYLIKPLDLEEFERSVSRISRR